MTYIQKFVNDEMTQYVFDAEAILLNTIDLKGYGDYNSIRLLDNQMNEIDLKNLRIVIYKESKNDSTNTNT